MHTPSPVACGLGETITGYALSLFAVSSAILVTCVLIAIICMVWRGR